MTDILTTRAGCDISNQIDEDRVRSPLSGTVSRRGLEQTSLILYYLYCGVGVWESVRHLSPQTSEQPFEYPTTVKLKVKRQHQQPLEDLNGQDVTLNTQAIKPSGLPVATEVLTSVLRVSPGISSLSGPISAIVGAQSNSLGT